MIQMNLFQKQRLIDTENKLKVTKRERKLVGGINWKVSIHTTTLLYEK